MLALRSPESEAIALRRVSGCRRIDGVAPAVPLHRMPRAILCAAFPRTCPS